MFLETVSYGAGTKDFSDRPNLLRLVIGKPALATKTQAQAAQGAGHVHVPVPHRVGALGASARGGI